jgi:hypothetical protein
MLTFVSAEAATVWRRSICWAAMARSSAGLLLGVVDASAAAAGELAACGYSKTPDCCVGGKGPVPVPVGELAGGLPAVLETGIDAVPFVKSNTCCCCCRSAVRCEGARGPPVVVVGERSGEPVLLSDACRLFGNQTGDMPAAALLAPEPPPLFDGCCEDDSRVVASGVLQCNGGRGTVCPVAILDAPPALFVPWLLSSERTAAGADCVADRAG